MSSTRPKKVFIDCEAVKNDPKALMVFVSSDRSDGKTTDKMHTIYDTFKQTGKIGVEVYRFVNDITPDVIQDNITKLQKVRKTGEITMQGSARKGVHLLEDGIKFYTAVPLSRASNVKQGMDVATHKNVYFDEYAPLNGRYLKDEVTAILEIWRTIDRDTFTNKIIFYSNRITPSNPLFARYGIVPTNGVTRWHNGRFILLQVRNKGNIEAIKKSPLADLEDGATGRYMEYATGGYLAETCATVCERHSPMRINAVIRQGNYLYGLFTAEQSDGLVIAKILDAGRDPVFTLEPCTRPNEIYLPYAMSLFKTLRKYYYTGRLFAESQLTFDAMHPLWKLLK